MKYPPHAVNSKAQLKKVEELLGRAVKHERDGVIRERVHRL